MFKRAKTKAATRRNFGLEVSKETDYPTRLSFYITPPRSEITVEDFQRWAIDRLIVLGEIESAIYRNKTQAELTSLIKSLTDKYLPLSSNSSRTLKGELVEAERRKDHYSHFILRLAFCRSEDLRARFIRTELALFKQRFLQDDAQEKAQFLDSLDLDWSAVSAAEKAELHDKLLAASGTRSIENESYFKVDWTKVPDLIAMRKVYLHAGMAYVPVSEQFSLISAEYANRLVAALELTARALPRLDEDDRLIPILTHLSKGFVAPEYTSSADANSAAVTAAQIPTLAAHFPLCMRVMHDNLQYQHHLKHTERLQYGLFLKGIGLNVEEALVFWRQSFSTVNDDKFAKEYRYNVRYNYGLEGSRKNYKPYSCQQILTGPPPGAGQCHGCPYKHFGKEALAASLSKLGISDSKTLKDVNESIATKHYHVACTKVFEATNPDVVLNESISHPNMYFSKAMGIAHNDAQKTEHQEVDNSDHRVEIAI
ncbi:DNA primase large subunit [Taphrina deformans PYCC 5710]|uniref:DNA primase large subunit n=1 Tax=Taphrina deformans (strain PYCC 5710 / ATCC 11124 / CBS 356.35 / IMI 108563 / JCM 9778 / NBRC 8474) TaxID=1097556 RepID=R4XIB3_TAPDE|nr:DNA primase large subunit [Taphrina deformans PYCC 5710]|eukprot:CCG83107.1 DNA primase large subunit [Taphrina deformans PYCC 5710]